MAPENSKTIEISLSTLRVLLFGDERLEGIAPASKGIGDTAKVKILPHGIGGILKEIDKDEEFFHVEFSASGNHAWCELWLSFEWKESNTRRTRTQQASAEGRAFRDKHRSRINEIKEALPSGFASHPGYAEQLAEDMMKAYKSGHISKILTIFNLAEKFQRYEEEDRQQS